MEIVVEKTWAGNSIIGFLVTEFAKTLGTGLRPEKVEDWLSTLEIDVVFEIAVLNEMRTTMIQAVLQDCLWLGAGVWENGVHRKGNRVKALRVVWR